MEYVYKNITNDKYLKYMLDSYELYEIDVELKDASTFAEEWLYNKHFNDDFRLKYKRISFSKALQIIRINKLEKIQNEI